MTDQATIISDDAKIVELIKNIIMDNYNSGGGLSNKKTIIRIKEILVMFNKLK